MAEMKARMEAAVAEQEALLELAENPESAAEALPESESDADADAAETEAGDSGAVLSEVQIEPSSILGCFKKKLSGGISVLLPIIIKIYAGVEVVLFLVSHRQVQILAIPRIYAQHPRETVF